VAKNPSRPSDSRRRLEQISHHFLSRPQAAPEARPAPFPLPLLLDSEDSRFPLHAFSQAFAARGRSCSMLYPKWEQGREMPLTMEQLLQEVSRHSTPPPEVCLVAVSHCGHPLVQQSGRALLLVHASLEGVRDGYLQLKRLAAGERRLMVGVIMLGVRDRTTVRRYFNKLATASRRFLNRELMGFGCVLHAPLSEAALWERDPLPTGLEEIADLVIDKWLAEPAQASRPRALKTVTHDAALP